MLIAHAGVYGESAERANESAWLHQLELYIGFILVWPVAFYGWLKSLFGGNNILGFEVLFIQFGGYAALYFIYSKWRKKKT